jgi:glycosyltransferase involved in cell wall biosynthesis
MSTIAILNVSEIRRDARVRRIASSLASADHRVVVVGYKSQNEPTHEHLEGYEVYRVTGPRKYGLDEMIDLERDSPLAGDVLRRADRRVLGERERRLSERIRKKIRQRALPYARRLERVLGRSLFSEPESGAIEQREIAKIRSMMSINHALFREAIRHSPHLIHANDLNSLLAGVMIKERTGARLVYDAHEVYPEQFAVSARSDIWHAFYARLEEILLPHTDARMTVCDSIARYYEREKHSQPFVTLRNVPSIAQLPPESILSRRNSPCRILYHGNYFEFRGLDEILRAAPLVPGAEFVFRGFGYHEAKLKELAREQRLEGRIHFAEPVDPTALVSSASDCDIGLNPFISVCLNTEFALPNKFFEYMMAGLALASSDLIEMRRLTSELQIGILFDSRNIDSIAEGLSRLISDPERLNHYRRNAYRHAKDEYHWEVEVKHLFEVYRALS